jgi:hypothetical protein
MELRSGRKQASWASARFWLPPTLNASLFANTWFFLRTELDAAGTALDRIIRFG